MLGKWDMLPITYAGGVDHILTLGRKLSNSKLDLQ